MIRQTVTIMLPALVGYWGGRALDYLNRGWTYAASDDPTTRELIKNAAAVVAGIVPAVVAQFAGAQEETVGAMAAGGMLQAIHRAARGLGRELEPDEGSFVYHMLTGASDAEDYAHALAGA